MLETIDPVSGASVDEVHRDRSPLSGIAERLKSLGLIVDEERDSIGRVLPTLIVLLVPLLRATRN